MFLLVLSQKKGRARGFIRAVLSCALLFLVSCTAATDPARHQPSSQLQAENSMMKKRLPLMERESDVLKKENEQLRVKLQDRAAQNKQLAQDLVTLREQYKNDMVVGEEQIRTLEDTLQKVEQEYRATLDTLLADNTALDEKRVRETRALKDQFITQKAAFAQQRQKLIKENDRLEAELAAASERTVASESANAALASSLAEVSDSLAKANVLAAELTKARAASQAELQSIQAAGRKASQEYLAQLESIKNTNAELNKKITELSGELSRQKHPEPNVQ